VVRGVSCKILCCSKKRCYFFSLHTKLTLFSIPRKRTLHLDQVMYGFVRLVRIISRNFRTRRWRVVVCDPLFKQWGHTRIHVVESGKFCQNHDFVIQYVMRKNKASPGEKAVKNAVLIVNVKGTAKCKRNVDCIFPTLFVSIRISSRISKSIRLCKV
jgi:hypothetical protein